MGIGIRASSAVDYATSLESTLDRATERYAATVREQVAESGSTSLSDTAALVLARDTARHSEFPLARLQWRGIEVSDDFQKYAARVASGEELTPYRGEVLARPTAEFPWGSMLRWTTEKLSRPRARRRSTVLLSAWLYGIGAFSLAVLAVGVGAAALGPAPSDDTTLVLTNRSRTNAALSSTSPEPASGALLSRTATIEDIPPPQLTTLAEAPRALEKRSPTRKRSTRTRAAVVTEKAATAAARAARDTATVAAALPESSALEARDTTNARDTHDPKSALATESALAAATSEALPSTLAARQISGETLLGIESPLLLDVPSF